MAQTMSAASGTPIFTAASWRGAGQNVHAHKVGTFADDAPGVALLGAAHGTHEPWHIAPQQLRHAGNGCNAVDDFGDLFAHLGAVGRQQRKCLLWGEFVYRTQNRRRGQNHHLAVAVQLGMGL